MSEQGKGIKVLHHTFDQKTFDQKNGIGKKWEIRSIAQMVLFIIPIQYKDNFKQDIAVPFKKE